MSTPDAVIKQTLETASAGVGEAALIVRQYPAPAVLLGTDGRVHATSLSGAPLVAALLESGQLTSAGETILAGIAEGRSHTVRCRTAPERAGDPSLLLDLMVLPVTGEIGSAPEILILSRDVTAEQHLIDALKHSRELYRDLVHASGAFYWEVNALGNFTLVPERGAFGYETDALEGRPSDMFALHTQEVLSLRSHFMTRVPVDGEDIWIKAADGSPVCLLASARPRHDVQGRWTGARGLAHDVTAERNQRRDLDRAERETRLLSSVAKNLFAPGTDGGALNEVAATLAAECEASATWCYRMGEQRADNETLDDALIGVSADEPAPRISEILSSAPTPGTDDEPCVTWRTGSYLCALVRVEGKDVLLLVLKDAARNSGAMLSNVLSPLANGVHLVLSQRGAP